MAGFVIELSAVPICVSLDINCTLLMGATGSSSAARRGADAADGGDGGREGGPVIGRKAAGGAEAVRRAGVGSGRRGVGAVADDAPERGKIAVEDDGQQEPGP